MQTHKKHTLHMGSHKMISMNKWVFSECIDYPWYIIVYLLCSCKKSQDSKCYVEFGRYLKYITTYATVLRVCVYEWVCVGVCEQVDVQGFLQHKSCWEHMNAAKERMLLLPSLSNGPPSQNSLLGGPYNSQPFCQEASGSNSACENP